MFLSFSLSRLSRILSAIYKKKIKTFERYVLRTFFLCSRFVTCSMRYFCYQREDMEEEEESLFLSNARICDENHFISFFSAKNEKFGREKDKRERRFESLFG